MGITVIVDAFVVAGIVFIAVIVVPVVLCAYTRQI
jgi:hypothetical protein